MHIYCITGVKILKPQSVVVDSKPDGWCLWHTFQKSKRTIQQFQIQHNKPATVMIAKLFQQQNKRISCSFDNVAQLHE